jgi:hypothetical protein
MFWQIAGWFCGLSVVALVILGIILGRRQAALEAKILSEGQTVLGWIVMANNALYKASDSSGHSYAVAVFTTDPNLPDMKTQLATWASALYSYEPPENPSKNDRIIGSVMSTQIPYDRALRLPDEITDGAEGYLIGVCVPWRKLPERKLTLPYVYLKVLLGDDGGCVMIEYPDADRK